MRPDQIPVRPLSSRATLSPADARVLFGTDSLSGRETVEVVRLGEIETRVPVAVAGETRLIADSMVAITSAVRLAGPLGATSARVERRPSRLLAPTALRRAWGLGPSAPVVLGTVALAVDVADGDLALEVDRALWLGAGRPETARWVAGLSLPTAPPEAGAPEDDGMIEIPRRVVTETDVRQAILKRRTIRLREGQIVTPAARAMARENGAFAE